MKNHTCYIIRERVEGISLQEYIHSTKLTNENKRLILNQIKKICTTLKKFPNIISSFNETDFIIDASNDIWLTNYLYGEENWRIEEIGRAHV